MLNIALPKGRLGDQVYDMLAAAGYDCPGYYEQNRKLVFRKPGEKCELSSGKAQRRGDLRGASGLRT